MPVFNDIAAPARLRRIQHVTWDGAPAWKKNAINDTRRFFRVFSHVAHSLSGLDIFNDAYLGADSRAALRFEASRYASLAADGFNVPRVLDHAADWSWMMTSDQGPTLRTIMADATDNAARRSYLTLAAEALAVLHAYGHCHGRPSLRDITINRRGIGWLDMDHDVLGVMPLADAQARDAFFLMKNVARLEGDDPGLSAYLAERYMRMAPAPARDVIARYGNRLLRVADPASGLAAMFGVSSFGGSVGMSIRALAHAAPSPRPAARGAARTAGPQA